MCEEFRFSKNHFEFLKSGAKIFWIVSCFWSKISLVLEEVALVWEFSSISINTISNESMPNGRKRERKVGEREKDRKKFH